jgi:hypothetical protein
MLKMLGRVLIYAGVLLIAAGLVIVLGERLGIRLGRLPGDIRIEGPRGGFYFPIMTCVIVSVVLSVVSWLMSRR